MRFAFVGCDRNIGVLESLQAAGWTLLKVFSQLATEVSGSNQQLSALAALQGIPLQLSRIQPADLQSLAEAACEVLIVASYNYKIPDWRTYLPYALNFHPSPLPVGRGPYPLIQAILRGHSAWAVSCHRIDASYDTGAVLDAEKFALDEYDTHETLHLKIQIASQVLAKRIAAGFRQLWREAHIQDEGEYWPMFSAEEQTLDCSGSVALIRRQLRAFGRLGCYTRFQGQKIQVQQASAWPGDHNLPAGSLVHNAGNTLVLACADGYLALQDWCYLPD
ncbi:formyl transferase [Undibacterium sp. CY7W]|uniref:Formyl transferase n=1 Tax=Undibacterium rugosum TaxID=2762291 RepID=A0A923I747_9BURK|nr:formyltransferase family protein [Undibacterium rugosum]MBC3934798.1 formyl transferase [Undibacterium rugosum]